MFYCIFLFSSFLYYRCHSYPLHVPEITAFFGVFSKKKKREKTTWEAGGIPIVAFGHARSSRNLCSSTDQIINFKILLTVNKSLKLYCLIWILNYKPCSSGEKRFRFLQTKFQLEFCENGVWLLYFRCMHYYFAFIVRLKANFYESGGWQWFLA